jgi:hypothetical protein
VTFGLPKLETAADAKNAAAAVIAAVAEGELTPSEASELARLLGPPDIHKLPCTTAEYIGWLDAQPEPNQNET